MRHLSLVVVLWMMLCGCLHAQEGARHGKIKKVDAARGIVTITVEGKDQEFLVVDRTRLRNAANEAITDFKEKGLPEGANVRFRAIERDGWMVLTGLRLGPGAPPPPAPRESIGVKPLTEIGDGTYKQESGGLYGGGHNAPPEDHREAARRASTQIRPLDAEGNPSADGKVVLMSIGMSNTTQEFSTFKAMADRDAEKSGQLVIVDGAQGGKAAAQWTDPDSPVGGKVWDTVNARLGSAGVTPQQVQVVWIKQALIAQGRFGEFPAHARKLEGELVKILQVSQRHFPNLRIAYLSSRIYAGYATTALNPEPYAYEGAFSIRWVIQSQIRGDASLNYDAARGPVLAPACLWGPYLWGDGITPRAADGLVWKREDLREDGTHPSNSGRKKVADLLLSFFKTDPYARAWFVKAGGAAK